MKKRKPWGQSVQELLGIRGFTRYGLETDQGELLFFRVAPINISVLSTASIETRIGKLQTALTLMPDLEIICTDSCECFDANRAYLRERCSQETNPQVCDLLWQDEQMLSQLQSEMSNARQFLFVRRCQGLKREQVLDLVNTTHKHLAEQGFEIQRMGRSDIKRFLGIYFGTSMDADTMPDVDGGQYLGEENPHRSWLRKKQRNKQDPEAVRTKDFFDCILPGTIRFFSDHYIAGDSYRCAWAIREYPPGTEEQAILAHLADRSGVTLRIYHRMVTAMEQKQIIGNANRKNRLMAGDNDLSQAIEAEGNLQDVATLLVDMRKNNEVLLHCSVFLELKARDLESLRAMQEDISMELTRAKLTVDRLTLRQKEGYLSVLPTGRNQFGVQYERVLPAGSVANLYPLSFSGKTDPMGFYIGRDKYGTNILVDLDRRSSDKTNGNVLILGNSGLGKSHLLKLLLTNLRESGKSVICLDPEAEYRELAENLGGTYIDFLSGRYIINLLEPKAWAEDPTEEETVPAAFRKTTRLAQHIAFLKDLFRCYKDFTDAQVDTIELLLEKLYARFGISDTTDYSTMKPTDYPILSQFYELCEREFREYDPAGQQLYTKETLREICLGLHSMCVGSESRYFNGYTNIRDGKFVVFGVKGLLDTNKRLKDTLLFNILSYMSNQLVGQGNTVASIDELYLFLTNQTAIEYIRNCMKRVRKKESSVILASQNVEDFLIPSIREFTKPMFAIPTHQFLFNPGLLNPREYMDALQIEQAEYDLHCKAERGTCLFRCGNERYLLQVLAPEYKTELFGKAGGR